MSRPVAGPQAENIPIVPDADNAAEGSMLNKLQRNPYPLIV
jgi:hypothetical protein